MEVVKELVKRAKAADLRRSYYTGTQPFPVEMASREHQKWFADMLKRSKLNLVRPVVDATAERLDVIGFQPEGAYDTFVETRLKALQNRIYREAAITTEAFVLVADDAGTRRVYLHGAGEMMAETDPGDDSLSVAYKLWTEDGIARLNIYDEVGITRLYANMDDGNAPVDIERYLSMPEDPYIRHGFDRVPVARFALESADVDPAIPVQDMLNKCLVDVLVGAEDYSLPKRYMTGVGPVGHDNEAEVNAKPLGYDPRRGLGMLPEGADIKQLEQADITKIADVVDRCAKWTAWATGTPLHYLTLGEGAFPSGEALRSAETRLTSRVTDRQQTFGPVWRGLMALLGAEGDVIWADAAQVTMSERVELALAKQRAGVSWEQTMAEMGYDEDTVKRMRDENEAAKRSGLEAFSAAMDAG